MIRYKWKCPICGAAGHKWMSRYKVRRNGRVHIKKKHNKTLEPKVMETIK